MTTASPTPSDRHRAIGRTKRPGDSIGTLLIVVALTLLIWIYAERAQNRDGVIALRIALSASDANNLAVDASAAGDGKVELRVNGPLSQIDKLKTSIETASTDGRLKITLSSADSSPGEKTIDLTRLLNETPLLTNSGVEVKSTSPSQIGIRVDPVISREVAVALPADRTVSLQAYAFEPAKVTVRGPDRVVNSVFGGTAPTVAVDIANLRGAADRGERSIDVPVIAPRDDRVTLNPSRVRLTFETNSAVLEARVPSVGILIERPLGDDGRSRVVMRRGPVITNVWLRGPANLVNKYVGQRPDTRLQAVLQVTQGDAGKTGLSRRVEFPYLERGLEAVYGPYEVTFDVKDVAGDNDR